MQADKVGHAVPSTGKSTGFSRKQLHGCSTQSWVNRDRQAGTRARRPLPVHSKDLAPYPNSSGKPRKARRRLAFQQSHSLHGKGWTRMGWHLVFQLPTEPLITANSLSLSPHRTSPLVYPTQRGLVPWNLSCVITNNVQSTNRNQKTFSFLNQYQGKPLSSCSFHSNVLQYIHLFFSVKVFSSFSFSAMDISMCPS